VREYYKNADCWPLGADSGFTLRSSVHDGAAKKFSNKFDPTTMLDVQRTDNASTSSRYFLRVLQVSAFLHVMLQFVDCDYAERVCASGTAGIAFDNDIVFGFDTKSPQMSRTEFLVPVRKPVVFDSANFKKADPRLAPGSESSDSNIISKNEDNSSMILEKRRLSFSEMWPTWAAAKKTEGPGTGLRGEFLVDTMKTVPWSGIPFQIGDGNKIFDCKFASCPYLLQNKLTWTSDWLEISHETRKLAVDKIKSIREEKLPYKLFNKHMSDIIPISKVSNIAPDIAPEISGNNNLNKPGVFFTPSKGYTFGKNPERDAVISVWNEKDPTRGGRINDGRRSNEPGHNCATFVAEVLNSLPLKKSLRCVFHEDLAEPDCRLVDRLP